jgi:hypothetical protein
MTDDEKAEMLASLVRSQNLLRDVQETIEAVAVSTKEVGGEWAGVRASDGQGVDRSLLQGAGKVRRKCC